MIVGSSHLRVRPVHRGRKGDDTEHAEPENQASRFDWTGWAGEVRTLYVQEVPRTVGRVGHGRSRHRLLVVAQMVAGGDGGRVGLPPARLPHEVLEDGPRGESFLFSLVQRPLLSLVEGDDEWLASLFHLAHPASVAADAHGVGDPNDGHGLGCLLHGPFWAASHLQIGAGLLSSVAPMEPLRDDVLDGISRSATEDAGRVRPHHVVVDGQKVPGVAGDVSTGAAEAASNLVVL